MTNRAKCKPHEVARENVSAPDDTSPPGTRQARLMRIDEYELEGLANPDSDRSFLTVALGNLFRDVCDLEDELEQTFIDWYARETLADVDWAVTRYLSVTRRIVRLAGLEVVAIATKTYIRRKVREK